MDFLLDVAAEVFVEKGFEAASVGEIAKRAKASKGTFYSRFPTKEKLFEEVVRRRADEAFGELASILVPDADPPTVFRAVGAKLAACILKKDSIDLLRLVYMESRHFPALGRIYYDLGPHRGQQQIAVYLKTLVKKGYLVKMDPQLAAEQFLDSFTGELVRRCALGLAASLSKSELDRRLKSAINFFLCAYRT